MNVLANPKHAVKHSIINDKGPLYACSCCFPLIVPLDSSSRCQNRQFSCRDFPGGPVVKNLPSHAEDVGSILGWGTKPAKIPQAGE